MSSSWGVRRALGPIVILFAFLGLAAAPPAALAATAPGSLCNTPSVPGCGAATDLPSTVNDQHYDLEVGVPITAVIIGATDLTGNETCTGDGPGVDVIIKSGDFGNQTVCGSLSGCPGTTCNITFTYTAPNGPTTCACNT